MGINPSAAIEVSAYNWVPDFAKGLVRDLRVRWALEEAGLDYRVRFLDARQPRPADYLLEQPFGQVPAFKDGAVQMFETGAIVLHIAEGSETLMPRDVAARARTMCWVIAALNSVEPMIMQLAKLDFSGSAAEWVPLARPSAEQAVRERLVRVAAWLGERDYLEDRFTAGDLMMTTMLRILRHTKLVGEFPNLVAYQARCEARPAFQRALAAQMAGFEAVAA
jgi:glutathione S-transferase